jgi:hypothetical protein
MAITNFDKHGENIIPGLLLHHYFIVKHATIPANMLERFG